MAAELKLSMLIQANAAQARQELAETGKAARDLGADATEVGSRWTEASSALTGTSTAAASLREAVAGLHSQTQAQVAGLVDAAQEAASYRDELDGIRDSFNPLFAASRQYEATLEAIVAAEQLGAIGSREAALAHDHTSRALIALRETAEAAGVPVRTLGPAGQTAATGMQQLIDRLNGVRGAQQGAAGSSILHGQQLDALRAKYNPLFAASRQYELQLREIAEAERLGAISAMEAAAARERAAASMAPMADGMARYGRATNVSTMHTANLAAQLNDIGVMMAYQNPIQLALQQGTQINQVFSQMGGGIGAVKALGGAFTQILNPLSLATIGIIAFGAAGFQWLMSMRSEAKELEDVLEDLSGAIDGLRTAAGRTSVSGLSELERMYGRVTSEVERLVAAQERLARRQMEDELRAFRESVGGMAAARWYDIGISEQVSGVLALQRELKLTRGEAEGLHGALQQAAEAKDLRLLADNFANIAAEFEMMERRNGALTESQLAFLAKIVEAEEKIRQLVAIDDMKGRWDEKSAQDLLTQLREEADIQQAILRYGEDSLQVRQMQVDAERRVFEEMLVTLDVSDSLKSDLRAAWENANGLADTDMASGVAAARREAQALANALGIALDEAVSIQAQASLATMKTEFSEGGQALRRYGSRAPGGTAEQDALARRNMPKEARGRRGGGTSELERQREAVRSLIASLEAELDILRETDPVMQEMIRHREVLTAATVDERAEIEELIRTRIEESITLDRVIQQMDDVRQVGHDVIRGIMQDLRDSATAGDILANVLDRIADKLLDLGASGFADILFGRPGTSSGGILGDFLGGLLGGAKKNALGDVVGSPTLFVYGDGRGLGVMGEAGAEAIMPLTHAMGAGVGAVMGGAETTLPLTRLASGKLGVEVPAPFALGGTFGHVPPPPIRPSRDDHALTRGEHGRAELIGRLQIGLDKGLTAQWEGRQRDIAVEITRAEIDQYDRHLPDRMGQISADPHFKG